MGASRRDTCILAKEMYNVSDFADVLSEHLLNQ